MSRVLPAEIVRAEKQGFSGPDASWFKGESIEYVRERLFDGSPIYSFFERSDVERLVNEHLTGAHNRRLLIWSLLNLEEWLRIFPGGDWKDIPSCDAGHWEA